jgi:hypothetical protein
MHDSEGFFDDIPEKAWREVQSAHNLQMLSQGDRGSTRQHIDKLTTSPSADWWTLNWEPSLTCQAQRRIGRAGDGGKWVCDPHRITEKATKKSEIGLWVVGSHRVLTGGAGQPAEWGANSKTCAQSAKLAQNDPP